MNIAILDDYHGVAADYADWSALGPQANVRVFREPLPEAERANALQPFDVIVIMRERMPFPAALVNALPNLRLLVTTGLRNNAVDMAACKARGVTVCGAPGASNAVNATAELAWTLILGLFKNLCAEDANMRRGSWQTGMPVPLARKRLGVLGLGKLGQAVARVGKAFDMDVVAWSPNLTPERAQEGGATYVSKQDLFTTSDVVSVHLILSDRTRNVVDAECLRAMKSSAFLVNTSRAGLVDQDALMDALRHKRIAGAGLDVFSVEPLPADDPVRKLDNVVLTPHLGYVSEDNFRAFYANAVAAIQAWADGKPIREL
ncbi:hydroxyacid dehydrogenase [Bordetella genomosp. 10]|uniref:Hydroxyacid dehydrogenase n=1 Tax=Bordetella genomosp. 10 TaxID=1416804 RepID=A0A261S3G9_9BORD|nr:D-2-hydroxyacid dehydrogenase family protein [Bordetella genomosp. 10]OZI31898.1 hydroxyacid dehydrogenase [Bordetella genomosp. 10]